MKTFEIRDLRLEIKNWNKNSKLNMLIPKLIKYAMKIRL